MIASKWLVTIVLAATVSGCGSIGAVGVPWGRDRQVVRQQPAPLPPPMSAPIESAELAPLDGTASTEVASDGLNGNSLAPPPGSQLAMAPSGAEVGRTDLLGGWTITAAGDSCQLFMTLTSWTGGYRASTRGCTSDILKSISAWNLQGTEVVLAGQGGSPLARLASSGANRFDGQANGQLISFYR